MSFLIKSLSSTTYNFLHALNDEKLLNHNARRLLVNAKPGYLCRVSLKDVDIGETIIVVNHEHQPQKTPYHATFAIFINEKSTQFQSEVGKVPDALLPRFLSVRAFNAQHYLVDADVCKGIDITDCIHKLFSNNDVSYLHLHHAAHGCFIAQVDRI